VRVDAALADESQLWQTPEERLSNRGSLPDQDQNFSLLEALGEHLRIIDVVVPDGHLVTVQLAEAGERSDGVEIVVKNRDLHSGSSVDPGPVPHRWWPRKPGVSGSVSEVRWAEDGL